MATDTSSYENELRKYGQDLIAYVLRPEAPEPEGLPAETARKLGELQRRHGEPLQSIFSLISSPSNPKPVASYYNLIQLDPTGNKTIFPTKELPELDKEGYWQKFEDERRAMKSPSFEAFCQLMRRYGWCIPAPIAQTGVSLYDYFKLVAALYLCEKTGDGLALVGGTVQGIQDWLYTKQNRALRPHPRKKWYGARYSRLALHPPIERSNPC
ncbi:MAG: hypothetical protein WCS37_18900, partial [Chloroflexota bacterium]